MVVVVVVLMLFFCYGGGEFGVGGDVVWCWWVVDGGNGVGVGGVKCYL